MVYNDVNCVQFCVNMKKIDLVIEMMIAATVLSRTANSVRICMCVSVCVGGGGGGGRDDNGDFLPYLLLHTVMSLCNVGLVLELVCNLLRSVL